METRCSRGAIARVPAAGCDAGDDEAYALAAGFAGVEVLPIENDFWRFYRLTG